MPGALSHWEKLHAFGIVCKYGAAFFVVRVHLDVISFTLPASLTVQNGSMTMLLRIYRRKLLITRR